MTDFPPLATSAVTSAPTPPYMTSSTPPLYTLSTSLTPILSFLNHPPLEFTLLSFTIFSVAHERHGIANIDLKFSFEQ
jgi:hypothetical protein